MIKYEKDYMEWSMAKKQLWERNRRRRRDYVTFLPVCLSVSWEWREGDEWSLGNARTRTAQENPRSAKCDLSSQSDTDCPAKILAP